MTQIDPAVSASHKQPAAARQLALEYLGFGNVEDRREYRFRARRGADLHQFTVFIRHAAFASRQAQLQDGPDICYQKLWRLLLGEQPVESTRVEVTEGELVEYRAARAPVPRGTTGPKPPGAASNPWRADGRPAPRERP
jgi:hypothetical protein